MKQGEDRDDNVKRDKFHSISVSRLTQTSILFDK